jgi:NitT/TauT family transport system permease protein
MTRSVVLSPQGADADHDDGARDREIPWYLLGTFVVLVLLFCLWQLSSAQEWVASIVLPPPSDVRQALSEMVGRDSFWTHVWVTAREVAIGFFLACGGAVVAATLCVRYDRLRGIIYPYAFAIQSFPKILLVPLFGVLFTYGMGLTIVLVAAGAFFPTFINTLRGYESASAEGVTLMRTMGASPLQVLRMFLLPSALPLMFTGLRASMSAAFLLAVIGEFAGAQNGLGYLINAEAYGLRTAYVYGAIVAVSVLAGIYYGAIVLAERVLVTRRR